MLHQTSTFYYVEEGSATFPAYQFTGSGGMGHTDPETALKHAAYVQEHIYDGHRHIHAKLAKMAENSSTFATWIGSLPAGQKLLTYEE